MLGTTPKGWSYVAAKGAVPSASPRPVAINGKAWTASVFGNASAPTGRPRAWPRPHVLAHVYRPAPADCSPGHVGGDTFPSRFAGRGVPRPPEVVRCRASCSCPAVATCYASRSWRRIEGIHERENVTPEMVAENIDKILDITDGELMNTGVSIPSP